MLPGNGDREIEIPDLEIDSEVCFEKRREGIKSWQDRHGVMSVVTNGH